MAKRIMLAVIGAGMGALIGLLVDYMGGGNLALVICAIAGAIVPMLLLGSPGR